MTKSNKLIDESNQLVSDFSNYFNTNQRSPSQTSSFESLTNINIHKIYKITIDSRCRLFILFACCLIFILYLLNKYKPRFIMKPRRGFYDYETMDYYYFLYYGIFISIALFIILCIIAYKFPNLNKILFINEDCQLCND